MTKIITLSEYGFKLETNSDRWFSCDKKIIGSSKFKNLKVGDDLTMLKYNEKGFIIDFTILNHKGQGVEDISNNSSLRSTHNTLNSLQASSLPVSYSLGSDVLEREEVQVAKGLNPLNSKPSSVQDNIRYAQCVNIAFNSIGEIDLSFQDGFWIMKGFNIADEIFKEFNKRLGGI